MDACFTRISENETLNITLYNVLFEKQGGAIMIHADNDFAYQIMVDKITKEKEKEDIFEYLLNDGTQVILSFA